MTYTEQEKVAWERGDGKYCDRCETRPATPRDHNGLRLCSHCEKRR